MRGTGNRVQIAFDFEGTDFKRGLEESGKALLGYSKILETMCGSHKKATKDVELLIKRINELENKQKEYTSLIEKQWASISKQNVVIEEQKKQIGTLVKEYSVLGASVKKGNSTTQKQIELAQKYSEALNMEIKNVKDLTRQEIDKAQEIIRLARKVNVATISTAEKRIGVERILGQEVDKNIIKEVVSGKSVKKSNEAKLKGLEAAKKQIELADQYSKALGRNIKDISSLTQKEKDVAQQRIRIAKSRYLASVPGAETEAGVSRLLGGIGEQKGWREKLQRSVTSIGSVSGVYKKEMGEFRGSTTGLRRAVGALRNNLLLVSFAIGGVVATMKGFVSNAIEMESALTGLSELSGSMGESMIETRNAAMELASQGLLTVQEASQALKTGLATGIGLEKTIKLINAMTDAAAFNRQGTLALGEAVVGGMQGYKNMLAMLVDNVGITKNLLPMQEEYAKSIGTTADKLTEAQKYEAMYIGILKEASKFQDNRLKVLQTLSGQLSVLRASWIQMSAAIGRILMPTIESLAGRFGDLSRQVLEFVQINEGQLRVSLRHIIDRVKELGEFLLTPVALLLKFKFLLIDTNTELNTFSKTIRDFGKAAGATYVTMLLFSAVIARLGKGLLNLAKIGGSWAWTAGVSLMITGLYMAYNKLNEAKNKLIDSTRLETEAMKESTTERQLELKDTLALIVAEKLSKEEKDKLIKKYGSLSLAIAGTRLELLKMMEDFATADIVQQMRESLVEGMSQSWKEIAYFFQTPAAMTSVRSSFKELFEQVDLKDLSGQALLDFQNRLEGIIKYIRETQIGHGLELVGWGDKEIKTAQTLLVLSQKLSKEKLNAFDSLQKSIRALEDQKKKLDEILTVTAKIKASTLQGILPSFDDMLKAGVTPPSKLIDIVFDVSKQALDEKMEETKKTIGEAIAQGKLFKGMKGVDSTKAGKELLDSLIVIETESWNQKFADFIKKATPSVETFTDDLFKLLQGTGKEARQISFIGQFLGGEPEQVMKTAMEKVNIMDVQSYFINWYDQLVKLSGEGEADRAFKAMWGVGVQEFNELLWKSFERVDIEGPFKKIQAKLTDQQERNKNAMLAANTAGYEILTNTKQQIDLEEEAYTLRNAKLEQILLLADSENRLSAKAVEYKYAELVVEEKLAMQREANINREIELLSRRNMWVAGAAEQVLKVHEVTYKVMENVSEAFFDNERRSQITMTKIIKSALQEQLAAWLDSMKQKFMIKATEATVWAGIYALEGQWGKAAKSFAIGAKWGALAGVVGGAANAARSSAQSAFNAPTAAETATSGTKVGTSSTSSGTKAGAITEASAMNVTISPIVNINGETIIIGSTGSIQEAGSALGMMSANALQQALETGEVDLTRVRRR